MDGICKQIADLQDLTEKLQGGRGFQGVSTLAHVYAIPPEQLGFNLAPAALPVMAQQVERPDDEIQADVEARAVPADVEVAEERQEGQVVEAPIEHDSVTVDGVEFSMSSSLAAIPAGCESLGLSKRGGKQKCLKRMI